MTKARRDAIARQLEKRNCVVIEDSIIVKDWSYAKGIEYSLKDKRNYHTITVDFCLDSILDLFDDNVRYADCS